MSDSIREEFGSYLRAVGLADAGPVQRRETRRAFFMGAWLVLCAVKRIGEDDSIGEEAGVAILQAMIDECEEFKARVLDGRD